MQSSGDRPGAQNLLPLGQIWGSGQGGVRVRGPVGQGRWGCAHQASPRSDTSRTWESPGRRSSLGAGREGEKELRGSGLGLPRPLPSQSTNTAQKRGPLGGGCLPRKDPPLLREQPPPPPAPRIPGGRGLQPQALALEWQNKGRSRRWPLTGDHHPRLRDLDSGEEFLQWGCGGSPGSSC